MNRFDRMKTSNFCMTKHTVTKLKSSTNYEKVFEIYITHAKISYKSARKRQTTYEKTQQRV